MALENEILKEYLSASHEIGRLFRMHYGKINLTFPQGMALSLLETEGTMTISTLAELMGSANSTISGVVDRLERMGFVRRVRSELDRRVIYVELTEQWKEIRRNTVTDVTTFFNKIVDPIAMEERETMLRGLQLINQALRNYKE